MKYIVKRSSDIWEDNPECQFAKKETLLRCGKDVEVYTVEIDTLEDLHKFIRNMGFPLVIFGNSDYNLPVLEIYDAYRE